MFHNAAIDGVIELSRKEAVGEDTDIKISDKVPDNLGMITWGSAYI